MASKITYPHKCRINALLLSYNLKKHCSIFEMNQKRIKMKNKVGEKIAEIRKRKGLTQEEVAEQANVNLRTIQRIENGETDPRGYTLSSICKVLNVNIEDILDYGKTEDKSFFLYLHLSVLTGCVIPLGDIIVPMVLWLTKKDKIIGLNAQAKNLLLFRGCFDIILLLCTVIFMVLLFRSVPNSSFANNLAMIYIVFILFYLIVTALYPIYIVISIYKSKNLKSYYPRFFEG